ncbi:MAG: enoyl-CoA hydratase/isomerase family protein [Ilumatobacteraceae bacterium]
MSDAHDQFETIRFEQRNAVGWITLNRPEVLNAFNSVMMRELSTLYDDLRQRPDIRVLVLTGAGDRSFCTGVDRDEAATGPGNLPEDSLIDAWPDSPFDYRDVSEWIGPKTRGLWKPMIAAVNGIACGGAFYFLGEVDFIIAADHATFFDPHVSYGLTAAFEPVLMMQNMPFQEIMRLTLLGNWERMSAQRAHQIGLVSEVVPMAELEARAMWAAEAIASAPPLPVQATLRSLWSAREMSRSQALSVGYTYIGLGNQASNVDEGQHDFANGRRIDWRLR